MPTSYTNSIPKPEPKYPFKVRWWATQGPPEPATFEFQCEEDLNEFLTSLLLASPRFGWQVLPVEVK